MDGLYVIGGAVVAILAIGLILVALFVVRQLWRIKKMSPKDPDARLKKKLAREGFSDNEIEEALRTGR